MPHLYSQLWIHLTSTCTKVRQQRERISNIPSWNSRDEEMDCYNLKSVEIFNAFNLYSQSRLAR